MKILICGDYGVFVNELINRLRKEKHDVFVITGKDKKTEYAKPSAGVFQDYHFNFSNKNISTIMKNVRPDVLIIPGYCDAGFTWENQNRQSVEYLAGITNLLMAAREVNIKKVLYCSSLGVYENVKDSCIHENTRFDASSVQNKTLQQMERICMEQNELDITIIRFPEIYGEYGSEEHDTIIKFLKTMSRRENLEITGNKKHRFLYVKDAVDAVMKVLEYKGKKNFLISGTIYTEHQAAECIKIVLKGETGEVLEKDKELETLPQIQEPEKENIGFYEKYSLEKGIRELYAMCLQKKEKEELKANRDFLMHGKLLPITENIALFLVVTLVIAALKGTWLEKTADFYLFYVVVVAVVYGCGHALFSTLLVLTAKTTAVLVTGAPFEYSILTSVLEILILGVIVGFMRDKYKRKQGDNEDELKYYQTELADMMQIYDGNRFVKETYEKRIITYENSLAEIYDIVRRLDYNEPNKVIFNALDAVKTMMEIEDAAIYTASGDSSFFRLTASSSSCGRKLKKSMEIKEDSFLYKDLIQRSVYRNKEIDSEKPSYACGVYDEDRVLAVIMLWTRKLTEINLYKANMLALISRLIEKAIVRAADYWNKYADHYIDGTQILDGEAFEIMYQTCEDGRKQDKITYTMLKLPREISPNQENDRILQPLIRRSDVMGIREDRIHIILMNTGADEAEYVIRRFAQKGIRLTPESGV